MSNHSELRDLKSEGVHFKNKYEFIILKSTMMPQIKEAFVGSQRKYKIYITICGNKMPTRCNRGFLLQILFLAQHVSGHHYAHHKELESIIQCLLPVVFRAVVFKLLVWCGAEAYVSGLQDAAASCKPDA